MARHDHRAALGQLRQDPRTRGEGNLGLEVPGPVPLEVLDVKRVVDDVDGVHEGIADLEDGLAHAAEHAALVARVHLPVEVVRELPDAGAARRADVEEVRVVTW